jgi:tetratricopeptide (TPR) repeat protein
MNYFLLLLLIFPWQIIGQGAPKNVVVTENTKDKLKNLAKDLFMINPEFTLEMSTQEAEPSFDNIPDATVYDSNYLKKIKVLINKDKNNTLQLNNLGNYFQRNNLPDSASHYYSMAKEKLAIKYFHKDSAYYYSFRAILKMNLNDTTATTDFDRALKINPKDSLTLYFYPMLLISNQKFEKANKMLVSYFSPKSKITPEFPYLFFAYSEVMVQISKFMEDIQETTTTKKELATKNYFDIIDYDKLNNYAAKYQDNIQIQNLRLMSELLGAFFKIALFEVDKNNKLILNFSELEKTKIREIITKMEELARTKKMNEFTLNKYLGFAYFMLNEQEKSLNLFKNAVSAFPRKKEDQYFHPRNCYDAISVIYNLDNDTLNFRKSLFDKMAIEITERDKAEEWKALAFSYLITGDLAKSEEYCTKIRDINPDNFDALRLLSHLNFLKGRRNLTEFFGQIASNQVTNAEENSLLSLQFAIYFAYFGDFAMAKNNIQVAKSSEGIDECLLCDDLTQIMEQN